MNQLSKQERAERYCRVIKYIRHIVASLGYSPTIHEIGEYMGWRSSASTATQLGRMRDLGLVEWTAHAQRTIHTTDEATKYLAEYDG